MSKVKRILKYALVAVAALCVVIVSAILPPYLAKKNDKVFLNVISKDTQASESYQYKVTKYQKTKVLYEIVSQQGDFYGIQLRRDMGIYADAKTSEAVEGRPAATGSPMSEISTYEWTVQQEILDGKDAAEDAVMTRAEAEMALVREARLLQSAGAIPQFDLGKQGDYSAVESIAFWRASDPTVSNSEFYYWQGIISNPKTGERYNMVIDDDIGKVYFMNIEYEHFTNVQSRDTNVHTDLDEKGLRKTADAFAAYHELVIDKAQQAVEDTDLANNLYSMTNKDYEIMTEAQSMPAYQSYKMVLKPSDIL